MMRAAALSLAMLAGTGLAAQERMVFEVASVKPNNSGPAAGQSLNSQGDTIVVTNMTVRDLITRAYQVQGFQIVAGPGWIANDRFDITAKAGRDLPPTGFDGVPPAMLMMRALLQDRFRLVVGPIARVGEPVRVGVSGVEIEGQIASIAGSVLHVKVKVAPLKVNTAKAKRTRTA